MGVDSTEFATKSTPCCCLLHLTTGSARHSNVTAYNA